MYLVGGVPPDGTPVKVIHTFHVELVILFDTLATLGIIFAVCCLLFNFIFKDRRYKIINNYYEDL
jgi:gamma-aminobutyric acid type B receptor